MIQGHVNALKQAVILLELCGANGATETVEAMIDTGFNGFLTVSPDIVTRLQWSYIESRPYELGDGNTVDFDIHYQQNCPSKNRHSDAEFLIGM